MRNAQGERLAPCRPEPGPRTTAAAAAPDKDNSHNFPWSFCPMSREPVRKHHLQKGKTGFPGSSGVKTPPATARVMGSIPDRGRSRAEEERIPKAQLPSLCPGAPRARAPKRRQSLLATAREKPAATKARPLTSRQMKVKEKTGKAQVGAINRRQKPPPAHLTRLLKRLLPSLPFSLPTGQYSSPFPDFKSFPTSQLSESFPTIQLPYLLLESSGLLAKN